MDTLVNICFEIPDKHECDQVFNWLRDHPKDIWNFEKRVEKGFHTQDFKTHPQMDARWSDDDILDTQVTRLQYYGRDSNIIQYEAKLKRVSRSPDNLVNLIRRCKSTKEGDFGDWTIRAWYRGDIWPSLLSPSKWTADDRNDGQPYYQQYVGFNENVLHPALDRHQVAMQTDTEYLANYGVLPATSKSELTSTSIAASLDALHRIYF